MQLQTRWYYERARGQYLDEKGRHRTASDKKAFEQSIQLRKNSRKLTSQNMSIAGVNFHTL